MKHYVQHGLKALSAAVVLTACLTPAKAVPITYAAPISSPFNLANPNPFLRVFNNRAGLGRTFSASTGERLFWTAFLSPSTDSDEIPFNCPSGQCLTTNGAATRPFSDHMDAHHTLPLSLSGLLALAKPEFRQGE